PSPTGPFSTLGNAAPAVPDSNTIVSPRTAEIAIPPVSVTLRPSCVQLRPIAPLSALPRQGKEPRTNVRCIAGSRAPPPPHLARTARDRTQGVLPGSAHPGFGPAGSARDPTQGVLRGSAHPGFGPAGSARDP